MCGRFTLRAPKERIKREFQLQEEPFVEARFNIAPTQNIVGVRQGADGREAVELKWGLIPSWAKDASMGARLINARSETVTEKPSFREAFKRRRVIIPADGVYEWRRTGKGKEPYFFRMRDDRMFGFAGVWDRWRNEEGETVESCAILTTEANEIFRTVHDRMPVILHPESYDEWLSDDPRGVESLKDLLRPYPSSEMIAYPVSSRVNSPHSQGEELIK
ncbi:MAG TPA: SOS response-associated peptidase [Pyrinomonadaceae bacterium]|nr:SOS response-associated peptidase [Pyrinomonadaceae bacterium]